MSASRLSRLVAILLIFLGIAFFLGRFQSRRQAGRAIDDSIWRLTYSVRFKALKDGVVLRLAIPENSNRAKLLNEEFVHPGLERRVLIGQESGTRRVELTAPHTGDFQAQAEFEIQLSTNQSSINRIQESLTGEARSRFLRSDDRFDTRDPNVQDVLSMARKDATDAELLQLFFDHCAQNLRPTTSEEGGDDVGNVLGTKLATPLGRARALVTLCRAVRMPARVVTGFELRQSRQAHPHNWVEVFYGSHWLPFDPEYGYARRMPSGFLPIQRGGEQIVVPLNTAEITDAVTTYSITRLPPPQEVLLADLPNFAQIFDLTRLPVEMHKVMSLMLLLPLGALVTAIFRNLVGLQTFGTFAPALLALSFIYADWGTGLLILTVVMTAGVIGRSLLERLHLLMVPRLSIILTTIIVCVLFGVSFFDFMERTPSPQAVLLPLVILTILIERMYVVAEEDGAAFTLQLVLGTLVVAACCYLLLRWDEVGRIMLIHPELHFFTVAAFIGIGRYTGYRLTELWRFRDLTETDELP